MTLPMGLHSSPAAFMQMISRVFKDRTRWNFLFCYVDDILLASSSFSEHVIHLTDVLHNLSVNNLVINPTKTLVAYSEIECLGYVINKDSTRIGDSKIKAIKAIQPPKNKRSLQRLLGLLQYFRNIYQISVKIRRICDNYYVMMLNLRGLIIAVKNWMISKPR